MSYDLVETRVERRTVPAGHRLSLMERIFVEPGTIADWHAMKALHYKADRHGVGPKFLRCVVQHDDGADELIGVIVLAVPKMLDAGRNEVFPNLKPNANGRDTPMMNRQRAAWVNKNMRLSTRNVIDTMYRGAGVGYRFRNIAMRMSGFAYIEARSSMSRFNPFYWKAGMRSPQLRDAAGMRAGLAMFARNFSCPAYDIVAVLEELQGMPDHVRERTLADMRDYYYRHSALEKSGEKRTEGRDRVNSLPVQELVKQIMQLTFGATIYAAYRNPDFGRPLPARIPILAFDNQSPHEPLRLDLL